MTTPQRIDLFGDPVPENWGGRGRPAHIPTDANRRKVEMLLAMGWATSRIANALNITPPTLRKAYKPELKFREAARDRLDARIAMLYWQRFEQGDMGAGKQYLKVLEKNDQMAGWQRSPEPDAEAAKKAAAKAAKEAAKPKLGKKEEALLAAQSPDVETPMGRLLAERMSKAH